MKKSTLLFLLPALIISSCGDAPVNKDDCTVNYELVSSIRKEDSQKTGGYKLTFNYKSEYFEADAKVFSKDLALLSNGMSLMAEKETTIKNFYDAFYFDDFESHYVATPTKDSLSYAFAHRKYEKFDLVSVAINGHNYGMEWSNNALLGTEGDHEGFSLRTNDVYKALKTYLAKYENCKLWISGFSRAGAIANMLSHYIISKEEMSVAQKDMFVYTFECPKGLAIENAPKYENVFNIIYSGDFIPYLATTEYGFARCGIDVDLYESSAKTDEVLYNLDSDNSIPAFKPYMMIDSTGLNTFTVENENDGPQALISYIARNGEDSDDYIYFPNREAFATKAQHTIQTVLSIAFTLPSDVRSELMSALMSEITSLDTAQKLYDFLTPYLEEGGYEYNPEELLADCGVVHKLIMTDSGLMMLAFLNEDMKNGLMRMFMVHFPEVGNALLNAYNPNK